MIIAADDRGILLALFFFFFIYFPLISISTYWYYTAGSADHLLNKTSIHKNVPKNNPIPLTPPSHLKHPPTHILPPRRQRPSPLLLPIPTPHPHPPLIHPHFSP